MSVRKKLVTMAASVLAAGGLVLGVGIAPASAASYNVSGTLNCGGAMAQYSTFRPHAAGPAKLQKTYDNWITGTQTRYGLRNTTGTQVTNTIAFNVRSYTTKSFTTAGGSGSVPQGSYAINARIGNVTSASGACGAGIPEWKGVLTL